MVRSPGEDFARELSNRRRFSEAPSALSYPLTSDGSQAVRQGAVERSRVAAVTSQVTVCGNGAFRPIRRDRLSWKSRSREGALHLSGTPTGKKADLSARSAGDIVLPKAVFDLERQDGAFAPLADAKKGIRKVLACE